MSIDNFNSIKVRLKQRFETFWIFDWLFQFHKGTIKTSDPYLIMYKLLLFQFHKGTIKTGYKLRPFLPKHISIP